jgi:hypothetical protein
MGAASCALGVAPFAEAEREFATITGFLSSEEALSVTHSDLERQLEVKARELMRKLLEEHLALRGQGHAAEAVRDAEGITRPHERVHTRPLETIFGTVQVSRVGYLQRSRELTQGCSPELDHTLSATDQAQTRVW